MSIDGMAVGIMGELYCVECAEGPCEAPCLCYEREAAKCVGRGEEKMRRSRQLRSSEMIVSGVGFTGFKEGNNFVRVQCVPTKSTRRHCANGILVTLIYKYIKQKGFRCITMYGAELPESFTLLL
jgi:hypothetical protein